MKRAVFLGSLYLAAVLTSSLPVPAQVTTATIGGVISDATGAVLAGAEVIATNVDTNFSRTAATERNGRYSIKFLPVGTYSVEVNLSGFKKFVQGGVVLELNRTARVDAILQLGNVSETISVTADAPLVNTADASIGRTVENTEILKLPLVNRDIYSLLNLTPGVESSEAGNAFGFPEQRTMINGSSNGGAGSVNYYLDGGTNMTGLRNTGNPAPNPDAVQEFRVITNSYGAEFGRFSGGVIDVITKSGTNQLHGSLFEFLRNDRLNANTYNATSKPPLRRNQFGGTFGGPLRADKTFFFGSYSGLRQRQVDFRNTAIVPTAAERAGDFSNSRVKPTDPLTRQAFAGNVIPAARQDPAAMAILNEWIPLPNCEGAFWEGSASHPVDSNEYQIKLDHSLTASHQLAGSYFRNTGSETEGFVGTGNLPWTKRVFSWRQHNANISDTWTVNPAMINQLRLTYVRNFGGRLNTPERSLGDFGSLYQIQGPPALPRITVTGSFLLNTAISGPVAGSNFYGVRDVFSISHGRHSIKFGGDISLEKFIHDTTLDNYGVFNFDGSRATNALGDFLLGLPRTMNQDTPITKIDNGWYYGLFLQDDFRIHPRLTLNLGLRYDLQMPVVDPQNRKATFVAGMKSTVVPTALPGLLFPGDPGVKRGIIGADRNNFAPRLGFAWDPTGSGKTSIRGAAGLFYGSISGNEWNSTADRQPFSIRQQFNNVKSLSDPYGSLPGGTSPFPYSFNAANPRFILPSGVAGIALDFAWPYTYQLNFSVERQLSSDISVSAAYVGALGHKLPFTQDLNYPFYNSTATAANVDQRRPYAAEGFQNINLLQSIMNTAYHGLQASAEKRMARRFLFKGFYTFSKSMEGARLQNDTTDGGAHNQRNLALERARTDNDRKHNVVASAVWQFDYFNGSNRVMRALLNDWSLSAITTLRSGAPFTVTSGRDNNLDGVNNDRPNLIGNARLDPNRSRSAVTNLWFDPTAFVPNGAGMEGTAGRNILDGPGMKNIDLGMFRDFRLRERLTIQFRGEVTNALNLVNLSAPTATLNSQAVGTIRTARAMRQVQLGLRLAF
jgi:hypothetical protein